MTARPRVAVDARTLQDSPLTGVGRALAHVLPGLAQHVELDLLVDGHGRALDDPRVRVVRGPSRRWSVWLETAAPRALRGHPGIFHCPYYGLPRWQPVPMVVTIHDLAFEHHPAWFPPAHRLAYRTQARHAARTARIVLTPSAHVAREVGERYEVRPDRIEVAPHGVPAHVRPHTPAEVEAVRRRHDVPDTYLVALGGRARRRVDVAVAVRRRLADHGLDLPLLVVGGDQVPRASGVLQRRGLADRDWAALLSGAVALVYPTAYEGFGLPAIEALASGTVVVAARVAALPEVLGDRGWWAEDLSVEAFADATRRLLEDDAARAATVEGGLARAADRRSWTPSVGAHLRAYRRAAA